MSEANSTLEAERCTLYLYDEAQRELWTRVAHQVDPSQIIKLSLDAEALASHAARSGKLINIEDAHADPRHDGTWDRKTGFRTKAVLCYPVVDDVGKLYGCIQAVNKAGGGAFTRDDEKLMRMLSNHISIFVQAINAS